MHGDYDASRRLISQARSSLPYSSSTYLAMLEVGSITCDGALSDEANLYLGMLRGDLRLGWALWDAVYREHGLGEYRALGLISIAQDPPASLVQEPGCQ